MEAPNSKGSSHLIVGLFVLVSLIVAGAFIIFMGGSGIFSHELRLQALFTDARGLNIGAPVYLAGVDVGRVLGKSLPSEELRANGEAKEKGVLVSFSVTGRYSSRVTTTAQVTISSAGMLGDKTLVIIEGDGGKQLKTDERIPAHEDPGFDSYLDKGGQALENVREISDELAKIFRTGKGAEHIEKILSNLEIASANLKKNTDGEWGTKLNSSLTRLDSILTKIDKGQGTMGALINDPSLHEDMRVLLGGAKRSTLIRFLVRSAIKNSDEKSAAESPNKEE